MSRQLRDGVLRGAFVVTLATLTTGVGFAADGDKCTVATKGDSPVAKACAQGGVKAAKTQMKQMVKTAKANGVKFDCDGCHKDDTKFELTQDARDNFKKLLAAQTK